MTFHHLMIDAASFFFSSRNQRYNTFYIFSPPNSLIPLFGQLFYLPHIIYSHTNWKWHIRLMIFLAKYCLLFKAFLIHSFWINSVDVFFTWPFFSFFHFCSPLSYTRMHARINVCSFLKLNNIWRCVCLIV